MKCVKYGAVSGHWSSTCQTPVLQMQLEQGQVLTSHCLMMQVLEGVSICFDGFDAADEPELAQLKSLAQTFGARCSSSHFTHMIGLRYTAQVGQTFGANCAFGLLTRTCCSAHKADCVLPVEYKWHNGRLLRLLRHSCMVCTASSPAACIGTLRIVNLEVVRLQTSVVNMPYLASLWHWCIA